MKRVIPLLVLGLLATFAGTVAAHTPSASLGCQAGLAVTLTQYNDTNGVSVKIDGSFVDGTPKTFGSSYSYGSGPLNPFVGHTANIVVLAHDDPTGSHGWSKTYNLEIGPCQEATPTPSPSPTPTRTPEPTPTPTAVIPTATPTSTPAHTPTVTVTPTSKITPPPTNTVYNPNEATADIGPIAGFLLLVGLLALVLILPATKRRTPPRS